MICPNCGSNMNEINIGGVMVDYCQDGCKGLFFDNFELDKMDEKHEMVDEPILKEILSQPRDKTDDSRIEQLICPRCNIKMRKQSYSYGTGIFLDRCYSCNGVWLDKGELAAIRENFRNRETRKLIVENLIKDTPSISNELNERKIELDEKNMKYDAIKNRPRFSVGRGLFGFFDSIF